MGYFSKGVRKRSPHVRVGASHIPAPYHINLPTQTPTSSQQSGILAPQSSTYQPQVSNGKHRTESWIHNLQGHFTPVFSPPTNSHVLNNYCQNCIQVNATISHLSDAVQIQQRQLASTNEYTQVLVSLINYMRNDLAEQKEITDQLVNVYLKMQREVRCLSQTQSSDRQLDTEISPYRLQHTNVAKPKQPRNVNRSRTPSYRAPDIWFPESSSIQVNANISDMQNKGEYTPSYPKDTKSTHHSSSDKLKSNILIGLYSQASTPETCAQTNAKESENRTPTVNTKNPAHTDTFRETPKYSESPKETSGMGTTLSFGNVSTSLPHKTMETLVNKQDERGFKDDKQASPTFHFGSQGSFKFSGVTPMKRDRRPQTLQTLITEMSCKDDYTKLEKKDRPLFFKPLIKLPKNFKIKTGEEDEDLLYCDRAKLFRFTQNEWKERGVGNVKILRHKETEKVRILMRREHVLKLCMNHVLTKDLKLKAMPNAKGKAWVWHCVDFAGNEQVHEKFAIKFTTEDRANDFKKHFETARDNPSALKEIPHVEYKSPEKKSKPRSDSYRMKSELSYISEDQKENQVQILSSISSESEANKEKERTPQSDGLQTFTFLCPESDKSLKEANFCYTASPLGFSTASNLGNSKLSNLVESQALSIHNEQAKTSECSPPDKVSQLEQPKLLQKSEEGNKEESAGKEDEDQDEIPVLFSERVTLSDAS